VIRAALPIVVDVVIVVTFATVGMFNHDSNHSFLNLAAIAWPFVAGLAIGWVAAIWNGLRGLRVWPGGLMIAGVTYGLGMGLRSVSGRGLETGFLIFSACFFVVTMLGWRGAWQLVRR
jgi:hypothetical protein